MPLSPRLPRTQAGAKVISMSLGGSSHSELEEAALKQAQAAGILIVAAAGNGERRGAGVPPPCSTGRNRVRGPPRAGPLTPPASACRAALHG